MSEHLCGFKGCVRVKDHGQPGSADLRRNHKYSDYGTTQRQAPSERKKKVSVPTVPSAPPAGSRLMRSLTMHRRGKTYKPGTQVKMLGATTEQWFFSEEIWDIDNPGWDWIEVKDRSGNARIFPLHRLIQ